MHFVKFCNLVIRTILGSFMCSRHSDGRAIIRTITGALHSTIQDRNLAVRCLQQCGLKKNGQFEWTLREILAKRRAAARQNAFTIPWYFWLSVVSSLS